MSIESRVQNLLRAAERAEREGNRHLAAILKKMADELGPSEFSVTPAQGPPNPS